MSTLDALTPRAQEVYKALTEGRDVTVVHKAMVLNVARMVDKLDRADEELSGLDSLTVINGQGTETINPLVAEQRMITSALSTILAKMGISELPEAKTQEKSPLDEIAERRAARERERAARDSNTANSLQSAGDN